MIPSIGLMIGAYIITRMLEMIFRPKQRSAGTAAIVGATLTIVVTIAVIVDLITMGTDLASQLRGIGLPK